MVKMISLSKFAADEIFVYFHIIYKNYIYKVV